MQYAKLTISFLFAMCAFVLPQTASATAYYIDMSGAEACGQAGTATTTAFCSFDEFTEAARSAGDIAFVRRFSTTTAATSDLTFTSDGTFVNPIVITADYDNLWNSFSTSTQTYSINTATSTFYADASITDISAGDWVYVEGDCGEIYNSTTINKCEFAYEVSAVSGTALSLYLPYRGNQSGSGLDLRIMPDAPNWNLVTGDFQWILNTDDNWFVKGINIRSTDAVGNINVQNSGNFELYDSILTGNGASDIGLNVTSGGAMHAIIKKTRFLNQSTNSIDCPATDDATNRLFIYQSIISNGIDNSCTNAFLSMVDSFLYGVLVMDSGGGSYIHYSQAKFRNTQYTTVTNSVNFNSEIFSEYDDGFIDRNVEKLFLSTNIASSTTSTVRSGGGPVSIGVLPTTSLTPRWDWGNLLLFEYPIYTDTSSKQYDVYFMSPSDTWTTNPTVSELWIECEYWSHNTGATTTRKIKKSTGTVDFNGSTAWQSLSVTCQPTQAGVLHLRAWYAKTKEAGTNLFYVDGTPVIQ